MHLPDDTTTKDKQMNTSKEVKKDAVRADVVVYDEMARQFSDWLFADFYAQSTGPCRLKSPSEIVQWFSVWRGRVEAKQSELDRSAEKLSG